MMSPPINARSVLERPPRPDEPGVEVDWAVKPICTSLLAPETTTDPEVTFAL